MRDSNLVLKAAAVESSSTNGSGVDFGNGDDQPLTYVLILTASVAPTTLDVKIQVSDDNSTWRNFLQFPQLGAVATGLLRVTGKTHARYRRYVSTIAGTSYNYGVWPEMGGEYTSF